MALGIDARSGRSLDELEAVLDRMKKAGYEFEILFLRLSVHEITDRLHGTIQRLFLCDLSIVQRCNGIFIDLRKGRPHDKECQKQCQPDQNLVGWRCLSTDRGSNKMQDNDDPGKRGQHDQYGRC